MAMTDEPHVLIVAGSDSSGGAGIARDIETVSAFGLRACLAVTAVTVQTHEGVSHVEPMFPDLVAAQMRAALTANRVGAIKIGMLGGADAIAAVAGVLKEHEGIPVILDPVLAATSGRPLLPVAAISALRRELMPLCALVTPNLDELAILAADTPAADEAMSLAQARRLMEGGAQAVLVKGGHASGPQATDLLLRSGCAPVSFEALRLDGQMRGTGCMLASAVAALMARGEPMEQSIGRAKQYVFDKLAARSKPIRPGRR
ncbi:hydroxymethylpyrimidine/phosphomethylpyrimidine kinase [Mesorhizobium sp. SP-1A]|uniref:hydroxymethylpyrimidine/phosphomethylpyrimidine kinase n=1 Tax=Mesorhizobium sp. SP-1A TaxID=3077840 RepID=UPI0028F734DB|nr:hydroxymethylpyrimidine/phosphomethylpyrimidine kinase [Mesorhizobium sp. SP-1A]